MSETTTNVQPLEKSADQSASHDHTNCWFTGDKWIPVTEMTEEHLRAAKKFAQGKEEYFFHKTSEWGKKVEMFDQEAERRGITLPERRSKFQRNTQILKNAIKEA